jgi:hypothetical protein
MRSPGIRVEHSVDVVVKGHRRTQLQDAPLPHTLCSTSNHPLWKHLFDHNVVSLSYISPNSTDWRLFNTFEARPVIANVVDVVRRHGDHRYRMRSDLSNHA